VFVAFGLQPDVNYHLACIYDGDKLCIHANNTLAVVPRLLFPATNFISTELQLDQNCATSPGFTFADANPDWEVGSGANLAQYRWRGTIDEVRCYSLHNLQ
jgi:hypothetical protein